MEKHAYKLIGMLFMFASGAFYTAERIAAKLAEGIAAAGGSKLGQYSAVYVYPHISDNFFVWFFLIVGFVLMVFGFPKRGER